MKSSIAANAVADESIKPLLRSSHDLQMKTLPIYWLNALFLLNLASTLFLTGLIFFVQMVHYPLFNQVGQSQFMAYHQQHTFWTGAVVILPMIIEALTALALLWFRPVWLSPILAGIGFALVAVIWLSTAFLQVPQHDALSQGFQQANYTVLVKSNWVRTFAWSLRSALLLLSLFVFLNAD